MDLEVYYCYSLVISYADKILILVTLTQSDEK